MSALFDELSRQLSAGHAQPISGLESDALFDTAQQATRAAVLIAVTDRTGPDETPGVLLTQRPATMRHHPGQVAFPGGKLEAGEDPIMAALREAEEELGIAQTAPSIVGTSDRYQTGTGFDITPVLAVIPPDLPLRADPREVDSWFEVPLNLLLERENWTQHEVTWKGQLRSYLEMHYEGYRIWGVTAAIIANLCRRLDQG